MSYVAFVGKQINKVVVEVPYSNSGWIGAIRYVLGGKMERSRRPNMWMFPLECFLAVYTITQHFYITRLTSSDLYTNRYDGVEWKSRWNAWRKAHIDTKHESSDSEDDGVYATLFLLDGAPIQVVKAAYRALSKLHHPDAGGDPEKFKKINLAYKEITSND